MSTPTKIEAVIDLSKVSTVQLSAELRARGLPLILWQPEDMKGFGHPDATLEERLADCRSSLEERLVEVGWDVIQGCIGTSEGETT
jgi:hypothetical protein